MLTGGAIVPHAPVMLSEVSAQGAEETSAVRAAISDLQVGFDGVTIVCSPHGRAASLYASARGDLADFGIPHVGVDLAVDDAIVEELVGLWGKEASAEPLDHGAVVPLLLLDDLEARPVVCCSFPEASIDETGREADALARAIRRLAETHDVAVVASAHTGAGLSPRAPLPEGAERWAIERSVRAALENDLGSLVELAPTIARDGGSCSASTFRLVGSLFEDRPAKLLCAIEPYGVGYVVVQVS